MSIHEIFKRKLVPIGFERTMGLLGATTLGIGALMGAGIYVLIGLATGHAGPAIWLSYLVCGLLSLLSVLVFGELSRRMPITGGGYAFVYNSLGSFWGFLTGWLLAVGSIFACAMYAIGFAYYFTSLFPHHFPESVIKGIALVVIAFLTLINCRGTKGGNRVQKIFTWGNLLVLLCLILLSIPKAEPERLKPVFSQGLSGLGGALAIIYVSFFGYQLVANNAEEIINPKTTVPRAMLLAMIVSLSFYVAVALISVMVVPWNVLAQSKAPLVEVAQKGIGRLGSLFIAIGGILASAAALNSTLLSQARQIFAMGKDRLLFAILGRIHEVYRTPTAGLLAGGLTTAIAVIFGDLTFIVKSANFCFIFSLLPASFALRRLYRSPGHAAEAPTLWRRYIPEAALLANLALLLAIDWASIVSGFELMGVGVLIYFLYSRKREIRSRTGLSVVLSERSTPKVLAGSRILVPMANPQSQQALFSISEALLAKQRGEVVALTVVETPDQLDFHAAFDDVQSSLEILERSTHLPSLHGVNIRPVVRLSRSLPKGIVHAAEEEGCDLIVMGYAGEESPKSIQLMEEVLSHARTDTILLKLRGDFCPKRIAVSLGGSINLDLMVRLAGAVADSFGGEIIFLNVLPTNYTPEQKAHSGKILVEAIKHHVAKALYKIEVESSDEPLEFLLKRSPGFDLLIVGATKVGLLERAVVGTFSSQIAIRSECAVAVVRAAPLTRKWLSI